MEFQSIQTEKPGKQLQYEGKQWDCSIICIINWHLLMVDRALRSPFNQEITKHLTACIKTTSFWVRGPQGFTCRTGFSCCSYIRRVIDVQVFIMFTTFTLQIVPPHEEIHCPKKSLIANHKEEKLLLSTCRCKGCIITAKTPPHCPKQNQQLPT